MNKKLDFSCFLLYIAIPLEEVLPRRMLSETDLSAKQGQTQKQTRFQGENEDKGGTPCLEDAKSKRPKETHRQR